MEEITDERLTNSADLWDQEVISEDRSIYRSEYLAYLYFRYLQNESKQALTQAAAADEPALLEQVQTFMAPRYTEGYVKGVHDHDATKILRGVLDVHGSIGLLRYPRARPGRWATVFWHATKRLRDRPTAGHEAKSFWQDP